MAELSQMVNEEEAGLSELPAEVKDWSKDHVRLWALKGPCVEVKYADILHHQDINGASLLLLEKSDLLDLNMTLGPAKVIIHARDELLKQKQEQSINPMNQTGRPCKPYPFHRHHDACRYKVNSILDVTESGASDYIEPCHEYKAYIHTLDIPMENTMKKFTDEVVRFAAACMNSRTNGTIHFGIGDKPEFEHGQVLGVYIQDKEAYENALRRAIEGHFEHKHIQAAKMCIKPPRFVEVLNADTTSAEKYVIEVDIVPDYLICEENIYHIYSLDTKKRKKHKYTESNNEEMREQSKLFFIRDGSSSRDLLAPTTHAKNLEEYNSFVRRVSQLSQLREKAEEKHFVVVKSSVQGSRLIEMITGGSQSLDKSHFEHYVIVTNKSHSVQLESLAFLPEFNPIAVLDFDPESAKNGLNKHFEEKLNIHTHLPVQYAITDDIENIARKLKLTRNTSWVFCNGCVDEEMPSDIDDWLIEKGASVRGVISFLCRKDVLPHKKFLVIFLLLSTVSEKLDPLLETFSTFRQELRGPEQILCICENEKAFTCWRDLIEARYGLDISARCIYELSFAEINGTVLSLWSENRRSSRFLPCVGGSNVLFEKKVEGTLDTLSILCVNQCEGGNEDKALIEESFYKGGKVSWWNFYFSEQPGSTPFIKRDKFNYIMNTVIPALTSLRKACVSFNLRHVPGCGGTTLAMHTLWALKEKYRCAVLTDRASVDFANIAHQVVDLLMHGTTEPTSRLPVLLMIDDFEKMENVYDLQQHIDKECVKRDIISTSPQVILLNCMRAESLGEDEATEDTVFIGNNLSEKEQKQFEKTLEEIEKTYKNTETFYGFMIMKKNFSSEYTQGVARNTLKSFNIDHKHAQLIAVLVLLGVYCKGATLSVSLCEEFLDLQTKPYCGSSRVEDGFGNFSPLLTRCTEEAKVIFSAMKMIHPSISVHCLQELTTTYNVNRAYIANLLLTTDKFHECIQGKGRLVQNIRTILVKRNHSANAEDSEFSPLIQDIAKQTPGIEEIVLSNAAKRFDKDAIILQLNARYQYLKRKNFTAAKDWARKAKDLSRDNSYISDTSAQVIKYELNNALANDTDILITPGHLKEYLKMAHSATDVFKETQEIAKKEATLRLQNKRDNKSFNTVGCVGEIQVAVTIIDILKKTPMFSSTTGVRHDILSELLSGTVAIQKIADNDPKHHKHSNYYSILKEFESLLCNLQYRMKRHFDFLDRFYVHLGPKFTVKDQTDERIKQGLFRCFQQYVNLFCKTDSKELIRNPNMNTMLQVREAKQFLVMRKADTHSGILDQLSGILDDLSSRPTEMMEKVVKKYDFILNNGAESPEERVNLVYANVALSCAKPQSKCLQPYQNILHILCQVLRGQTSLNNSSAWHFIAVALLWPPQMPMPQTTESEKLATYISQMKHSFHNEMQCVYNGKWPVVHFFLGKKQGYERLIHRKEIERCAMEGHKDYASLWQNGMIWKQEKVKQLLLKVTGKVHRNIILANTSNPASRIEVCPMFRSQISGQTQGREVSFFIGFSMNGPLAIDIH